MRDVNSFYQGLKKVFVFTLFIILAIGYESVMAIGLTGYIAPEGRYFPSDHLYMGQKDNDASVAIQLEAYHEWGNGSSITFVPFARFDSNNNKRSHYDIRELNFLWVTESFETRLGVGKVFWGAMEFVHLVDIINQTDLVENIDGVEKLGQPMLNVSIPFQSMSLDFFVLPYFRERTFPGEEGRLRAPFVVDTNNAQYEDKAKQEHVDYATRLNITFDDFDVGLSFFNGTNRDPNLVQLMSSSGTDLLIPYYEQIRQAGIDLTGALGEWLLKLEAIYRWGSLAEFYAVVGGFEYTFIGFVLPNADLGMIVEYAHDQRGIDGMSLNQNDAMFGLRLVLNDQAGTEILTGFSYDRDTHSKLASVRMSRRIGDSVKLALEGWITADPPKDDVFLYYLRDDDFIGLEVTFYY